MVLTQMSQHADDPCASEEASRRGDRECAVASANESDHGEMQAIRMERRTG